ncbi:MAG: ATP-binding protein, partial [Anaerolineae bacterium]|nr:ATP-binding protein [Anaerolineae bacterium]
SSQRLSHLIENYLVYAQLELISSNPAKIAELRQQETENAQHVIVETAIAAASGYRRESDLDIDLQGDIALPIGQADLQKVITELVDNACKFSESGTLITIRGYIFGDRFYRVTIHDQGRGMTEEQVSQVGAYMQFERKLYEQQGLGLGLAIARQIIRFYNGVCHLHSISERETTLTIDLPLWQPPQN